MSKKLILDYLQKHALDLIEKHPQVVEASFAPSPSRILIVATEDFEPPAISHKGKELKVEVAVNEHYEEPEVAGEDPNLTEWKQRHNVKPQGVVDNVVDVSASSDRAQDREAYSAWKKRHANVKVHKE